MSVKHIPVLLSEVIDAFEITKGNRYIDATFGFGGHAIEVEKQGGKVLGIEQDQETIDLVKHSIKDKNITLVKGNFRNLTRIAKDYEFDHVDGILLDLGYSSWQLNKSGRGITFQEDEVLDMRLDLSNKVTAYDVVNNTDEAELTYILSRFGEEDKASEVAAEIQKKRPINTSKSLRECIEVCVPKHEVRSHMARIFQAIRIVVNDELEALKEVLPQACELMKPEAILCVISFHSLEDRIVKRYIKNEIAIENIAIIRPTKTELEINKRAGSATLRVAKKI